MGVRKDEAVGGVESAWVSEYHASRTGEYVLEEAETSRDQEAQSVEGPRLVSFTGAPHGPRLTGTFIYRYGTFARYDRV